MYSNLVLLTVLIKIIHEYMRTCIETPTWIKDVRILEVMNKTGTHDETSRQKLDLMSMKHTRNSHMRKKNCKFQVPSSISSGCSTERL